MDYDEDDKRMCHYVHPHIISDLRLHGIG